MTDEQWRRAWDIYETAADLAGEEKRSFLDSVNTDPEVLDEVVSMLEEAQETTLGRTQHEPRSRSGIRFSRYEVGEMLSSGGMGEVYSASDPELGRKVAIKFLNQE